MANRLTIAVWKVTQHFMKHLKVSNCHCDTHNSQSASQIRALNVHHLLRLETRRLSLVSRWRCCRLWAWSPPSSQMGHHPSTSSLQQTACWGRCRASHMASERRGKRPKLTPDTEIFCAFCRYTDKLYVFDNKDHCNVFKLDCSCHCFTPWQNQEVHL